MLRLVRWIDRISLWSGKVVSWLTLAATLILTYEVTARYLFGAPTGWAHDTSTLLFGMLYALAGAYTHYMRNHVGVDLLYSRLSPRARAGVDVFTAVLFFVFVGAFFWYGWLFFADSFGRREFSLNNQDIPIYPAKFAIPLGGGLLLLQGIAKFIRDAHLLLTGRALEEARAPAETPVPAAQGEKPAPASPDRSPAPATRAAYRLLQRGDAE